MLAIASISMAAACTTAYYRTLEAIGIEKRDILVDRIADARDSQSNAKDQFASALERYRSVVDLEAGELFLRHNLNARAIGSLENELDDIEQATAAAYCEAAASISAASSMNTCA